MAGAEFEKADLAQKLVSFEKRQEDRQDERLKRLEQKIQKFNAVNIEMGYKSILIFSPREVTTYGSKGS